MTNPTTTALRHLYFNVLEAPVAAGWAAVVDNSRGLQRFVFRCMRDHLRRVSTNARFGCGVPGRAALQHVVRAPPRLSRVMPDHQSSWDRRTLVNRAD
jgi:hypothetical protein